MNWLKRIADRRRRAKDAQVIPVKAGHTYVMQAEWRRTEELRPDRLGPGENDLTDEVRVDPWRPQRTLGPMRKR